MPLKRKIISSEINYNNRVTMAKIIALNINENKVGN